MRRDTTTTAPCPCHEKEEKWQQDRIIGNFVSLTNHYDPGIFHCLLAVKIDKAAAWNPGAGQARTANTSWQANIRSARCQGRECAHPALPRPGRNSSNGIHQETQL